MQLKDNDRGGYRYLAGISAYSSGVVALPGHEIVHATLAQPIPLAAGFDLVAGHLDGLGRPRQALCAMELRSPKPFSFDGFADFNIGYADVLRDWDIHVGDDNPVARTNVAPEVAPPAEPSLYAFAYTVPSETPTPTFVVAGAGEVHRQSLEVQTIVREGETGPDAMAEKAAHVLGVIQARMEGLGADWPRVTATDVYTVHQLQPYLASVLLEPMGAAAAHGVRWHFTRPPIEGLDFEMDARGIAREIVLPV